MLNIQDDEFEPKTNEIWFKVYNNGRPVDTIPATSIDALKKHLEANRIKYTKIVPLQ